MQQWEYMTVVSEVDIASDDLLADIGRTAAYEPLSRFLASKGADGWELVSLEPVDFGPGKIANVSLKQRGRIRNFLFVFKRPKI